MKRWFVLVLLLISPAWVQAADPPNIVFILIDDMGWKDMGCAGSTFYETPHIDQLARSGLRFVNAYSASPVCAPSRGAIFSGLHPARTKFTTVYHAGKEAASDDRLYEVSKQRAGKNGQNQMYEALHRHNLPSTATLFSESLRGVGYATGFFGKWHCGSHEDYRPDQRGFEVAIGYRHTHIPTARSRHWGRTFRQYGVGMEDMRDDDYVADYLTDKCIDFIQDSQEKPFVAVLSHYLVHSPIEGKLERVQYFEKKAKADQSNSGYAAMLASVDESVGRIVGCLNELGIAENTLVIFTSDNGGLSPRQTSNYPLLGGKSTCFEGGVRVPLIASWPDVIKAGQVTEERAVGMDYYPTFLEVAEVSVPADQQLDGVSLLPIFKGTQALVRRPLIFHFPHYTGSTSPYSSVVDGGWKLIEFYNDEQGRYLLFDLTKDEGEQQDLSDAYPERVGLMAKLLRDELQSMGAELPVPNPRFNVGAEGLSNRGSNYENAKTHYEGFKAVAGDTN
ncbi:MAG: sulfatase [Planctomycetota bacterium]